jgi:hypothetical protein
MILADRVRVERRIYGGIASDSDIETLAADCVYLEDRPCLEWVQLLETGGWTAPDGAILPPPR